jgi:hypothetical protein
LSRAVVAEFLCWLVPWQRSVAAMPGKAEKEMRRLLACVLLLVTVPSPIFAQAPAPVPVVDVDGPGPADPVADEEADLPVFRGGARDRRFNVQTLNDLGEDGEIYTTNPDPPYTSSGVLVLAKPATPDLSMRLGSTLGTTKFGVYDSSGNAHFRVFADGKILMGKGVSVPNALYQVQMYSATDASSAMLAYSNTAIEADTTQKDVGAWLVAYQNVAADKVNSGSAVAFRTRGWLNGPGRLAATYGAFVESGVFPAATVTGTVAQAYGVFIDVAKGLSGGGHIERGYGLYINNVYAELSNGSYGIYQAGTDDLNYLAGKVGIGVAVPTEELDVVGDLKVSGTITGGTINGTTITGGTITGVTVIGAVYQDLAEWVPATTDLAPGTVVVLNHGRNNEVMASHRPYDTSVAGVVSAQPGVILGVGGEGREQIATTGRVKVRIDARGGAIAVGDLLVTSEMAGTAMKSEPIAINGRSFHQPGTIIGKALEPLEGGIGEILVLLSMQ